MIHFIIGTRAQLIKTAPIMWECSKKSIDYNFIFIAQHRETIFEILDDFCLKKPDHMVNDRGKEITNALSLAIWALSTLGNLLLNRKKYGLCGKGDCVILHGDALPVLIGALAARLSFKKVALVESGLRSFSFFDPFPEELIRYLTWKAGLVDHHFCFDHKARENLRGFRGRVFNVGMNTMFDAQRIAAMESGRPRGIVPETKYAVVTVHRYENLSSQVRLKLIINSLLSVAEKIKLIFVLHPSTKSVLEKSTYHKLLMEHPNIELKPRFSFFDFNTLLTHSEFVMTDGGSNQEECFYMGKPCLLLRKTTERHEGIGENVVLSGLEYKIINHFADNYKSYRVKKTHCLSTPSAEIVKTLGELGFL